jgi:single-strand DNA-binding protein
VTGPPYNRRIPEATLLGLMANFNRVILLGNLTRDVEVRYTQGGMAVAKLGMAINRKFRQGEEERESTCFVDLTAFGRQAEILEQYVSKGSPLFVEGRLEYSSWEAKDGSGKRNKLEVVIENFQFLGGGERAAGGGGGGGGGASRRGRASGGNSGGAGQEAAAEEFGGDDFGGIPF